MTWLREVFTGLSEKLFGPTGGRSLRTVFTISCLYIMITAALPMGGRFLAERIRQRRVHAMQDRMSAIEQLRLTSFIAETALPAPGFRELRYLDATTRAKIIVDVWEDSRLTQRTYFHQGNILSRDTFLYQDDRPSGKRREYFEDGARVMVEEFSQTGLLLAKHHCKKDDPSNCRDYMRDFRSPLPPINYVFYR